ncbi:Hypothetical protein R9X50_00499100 [Acrodontium crateriforme]|uniref:F-box domain-containing protein n=1 Tax=Acrodontium crateriforme TaxID=150365 RepID=A0AAQ3R5J9_9PEZI|nr:Hypothetical protein R9X50_00499100 [Acrodontium crateriforme]
MAFQENPHERVFSLVAHQPRHIVHGMIRITEPAKLFSSWRLSPSSSLGDLDALPLELLHVIFAMLDFKSLSDISRTCLRANIHAALLSADCISCGSYGAFLFLPTCERCCYHCLWRNQSLWVIPISTAKKCFGFSAAGAKTLSIMHSLPGKYHVRHTISRQRPIRLVCVGAAKKLAIAENRSEDCMRQDLEHKRSAGLSEKEYYLLRFLQKAQITPPGPELFVQPTESNVPNDMFCGMASLPFPYLAPGNHAEHGFWCLGCELVWRRWSPNDSSPDHLSHLVLPGCRAADIVYNMQDVARSKAEFLSHINECPGAKELCQAAREH